MGKPSNWVFEDPLERAVDTDNGSEFRKELKSDAMFCGCPYDISMGEVEGPVAAVRKAIAKLTGSGELRNYVILTKRPAVFAKEFISNNVIDVAGKTEKQVANDVDWVFSGMGRCRKSEDEKTFFTSDSHFFHRNIIDYCDRPWSSGRDGDGKLIVTDEDVSRMNEDMVKLWNETVGKDDVVWHLGDFCLGKKENYDWLFPVEERDAAGMPTMRSSRLNGRINLVLGNHDCRKYSFYTGMPFRRVYDVPVLIDDFIVLSHAPLNFVKAPFFNIFGHVHSTGTFSTFSEHGCCVCVERHGYRPVSLAEIKRQYAKAASAV